ncbi:6-phospho-3-hexuloisomerase [Priestia aryabhattai B8W22]|nr:6-phospho-3-hexuloisomerase [Priestia aryabhattai B8W22]
MKTTQYLAKVVQELSQTIHLIGDSEAEKLINQILESKKIFVAGSGRSGLGLMPM